MYSISYLQQVLLEYNIRVKCSGAYLQSQHSGEKGWGRRIIDSRPVWARRPQVGWYTLMVHSYIWNEGYTFLLITYFRNIGCSSYLSSLILNNWPLVTRVSLLPSHFQNWTLSLEQLKRNWHGFNCCYTQQDSVMEKLYLSLQDIEEYQFLLFS